MPGTGGLRDRGIPREEERIELKQSISAKKLRSSKNHGAPVTIIVLVTLLDKTGTITLGNRQEWVIF